MRKVYHQWAFNTNS